MGSLVDDPFATEPKTSRSSFYDRERELSLIEGAVREGGRLVLVLGVRRAGKTSLIRVALNELGVPHVFLDLRALGSYEDRALYGLLSEEINRILPWSRRVVRYLKRVRGVSVGEEGVSIELGDEKPNFVSLLRALDEWAADEGVALPVVLDEAQELRFFRGGRRRTDFRKVLAYCYDNLKNTTFILSGSEVGLLFDFVGVEDPRSPFFGRRYVEVRVERLSRESSLDFLVKGFEHHGLSPPAELLERAVEAFDGIIGWLTYFGAEVVALHREAGVLDYEEAIRAVRGKAVRLCAEELRKLAARSRLYLGILAALGEGGRTWSEIALTLERKFKRTVSSPQLGALLRNLIELSYVEKRDGRYWALDPLAPDAAALLLSEAR